MDERVKSLHSLLDPLRELLLVGSPIPLLLRMSLKIRLPDVLAELLHRIPNVLIPHHSLTIGRKACFLSTTTVSVPEQARLQTMIHQHITKDQQTSPETSRTNYVPQPCCAKEFY